MTATTSLFDPDALRVLTIFLSALAAATLPGAIGITGRPSRVYLLIAVIELQFIGAMIAIADSFGEPLIWWRTPRILIAALLALTYVTLAFWDRMCDRRL